MSSIPEQFKAGYQIPFQRQPKGLDPGHQHKLNPTPIDDITSDGKPYKAAGKLEGRSALVTGADSGIGRAVAVLFALEGAALTLHGTSHEEIDLKDTLELIKHKTGGKCKSTTVALDLRSEDACKKLVKTHLDFHGSKLDTLVLNHGSY